MARTDPAVPLHALKRQESLGEQIYAGLRTRLKRGDFPPGHRLVDVDLAASYGTSRMPVREALLRLVTEGYLVGTMRGFAVPHLSAEDIHDIFEVRRRLEPYAAGCAARDLTDTALARLAAALEQARQAQASEDLAAIFAANITFRDTWLGVIRNQRLTETISRFADHVQAVRLTTLPDKAVRKVVLAGLEGLYEAFAKRDAALAERRMKAFMTQAEKTFFRVSPPATRPKSLRVT